MPSLLITPENQIQRLNLLIGRVQQLRKLDRSLLITAPGPKSWSVLEIIEHLNIAYGFYIEKIDAALARSADHLAENGSFKARAWQRLVIMGQRPKNGKRKWKMKTLGKFEPILAPAQLTGQRIQNVFENFESLHQHLKQAILGSRQKEVSKTKITSAIGPVVTFYLPECFEFLVSHAERHAIQIEETLNLLS